MAVKNISAFAIYKDQATLSDAIEALKTAGFRHTDISALYPDNMGLKDFGHERHTKAPEGAVAGGGSGAIIGAAMGWLAGAGMVMIPGLETVAMAGPVMGTLSGLGAGVTVGGIMGAIAGSGVPEYEAKRYEGRIRKGGILLSVHCDNSEWAKTARTVLKRTGGLDIATTGEARADFARSNKPLPRARMTQVDR